MTTNPLAIIAMAIQDHTYIDDALPPARAAANALTDPAIVDHAVQAMVDRGYDQHIDEEALAEIATVVLASVAGEA